MSQVPAILAEIRAKRVEAERAEKIEALLEELKVPWSRHIWSILRWWMFWAAFLVLQIVLQRRLSNPPPMTLTWVMLGAVIVLPIASILSQMRKREKAWRALVALKAPELLREIYREKEKDANRHRGE